MSLTLTPRPGQARSDALSGQLRARTRREHVEAESAFALESRLLDLGTYRQLLVTLGAFYLPLEATLTRAVGRRFALPVDVEAHLRGDLLLDDLSRLTAAPGQTRVVRTTPTGWQLPELESPAQALGALYVVAGSALGGQVIAGRARAVLGDDVPVSFFGGRDGLAPRRRWRALQAALDDFGATAGSVGRKETVQAARGTFRALTGRLDARG